MDAYAMLRSSSTGLVLALVLNAIAAVASAATGGGPSQPIVTTPSPSPFLPMHQALPGGMAMWCRTGAIGVSYEEEPGYNFVVVVSAGYKNIAGVFPPFSSLGPGECGATDPRVYQPSQTTGTWALSNRLCFRTGSVDKVVYAKGYGGLQVFQTTPSVVGDMVQTTNHYYQFSVHPEGDCAVIDSYAAAHY